jgi:hypothetical protein
VRKALVGLEDRLKIDDAGGDLTAHGNILDHEYAIDSSEDTVASVSNNGFHHDALTLAITVCLDTVPRDWRRAPAIFDAATVSPERLLGALRRFDPARPWTRLPRRP